MLATLFLVVFIDLLGFGLVIPILPYYATEFGASATTLGLLMTSFSFAQFLFSPFWGKLSDRIGRRPVLLATIIGSAGALFALASANSIFWLFVGRLLAGIFGANISTAMAYIADVTTEQNRAKGMGMIGAAFGLGFIFGPAVGGLLSKWGYATPVYAASGLALINFIFAIWKLPEPPITPEQRAKNRSRRTLDMRVWKSSLSDIRTRGAVFLFFFVTIAFAQVEVIYALFMRDRFHFGAQETGWMLAMVGIVMVAIQGGLIGKISKRFGETRLIAFGTGLMGVGLFLMATVENFPLFVFANLLLAIGNALNMPSLSSLCSQGAKPEERGIVMGIYQSSGSLARILGPPIAGWTFDQISVASPFRLSSAMMVFCSLATVLVFLRKKPAAAQNAA